MPNPAILQGVTVWTLPAAFMLLAAWIVACPRWPTGKNTGWLFWAAWTFPFAYTLTPSPIPRTVFDCTAGNPIINPAGLLAVSEPSLNALLFVPAGAALWLIPNPLTRTRFALALAFVPPAIEAIQRTAGPHLNRACEYGDIWNNLIGAATGITVGAAMHFGCRALFGPASGPQ